jgi:hypothetical protein
MTVKERLDTALERIERMGARAVRIVLTEADLSELRDVADLNQSYRGTPVDQGQIGGHSYVESEGAPSGDTSFAI